MKTTLAIVAVLGLLLVGAIATSNNNQEESGVASAMAAFPTDLAGAVQTAIDKSSNGEAIVMDVRTTEEWNTLHADGAVHFSLEEQLVNGELPDIAKDEQIYVYCRSGNRSTEAIGLLERAGYTNLVNIRALQDWINAGGGTTSEKF